MADEEFIVFSPRDYERIKRLVLAYERGELTAKPSAKPQLAQGWARIERFRLTEDLTAGSDADGRITVCSTSGTWSDGSSHHPFYSVTLKGGTTSMAGDEDQPVWAVLHRQSKKWWILQKDCPA